MLVKFENDIVKIGKWNNNIARAMREYRNNPTVYASLDSMTISHMSDMFNPLKYWGGYEDTPDGFYACELNDNHHIADLTGYRIVNRYDNFQPKSLDNLEEYTEWRSNYGVCDNPSQILLKYPELQSDSKQYVVLMIPMYKHEQPSDGGWGWHKWGDYIGNQNPQCEYLYDEPEIDLVFVYHIYEVGVI